MMVRDPRRLDSPIPASTEFPSSHRDDDKSYSASRLPLSSLFPIPRLNLLCHVNLS